MSEPNSSDICSMESLVKYLDFIVSDCVSNGKSWDNNSLERYLEAVQAWLIDSRGFYVNLGEEPAEVNPWRQIADALNAARSYE